MSVEHPRVSVIVLGFASGERLQRCLTSVRANLSPTLSHEVVVLVNGPHMDWTPGLHDLSPQTRIVHSPVNLGFAGGCNWVAREARGEHLVFLNDDAIVESPAWIEELVRTADRHPEAGAVGSRMVTPQGCIGEAGSVVWSNGGTEAAGRGLPFDAPDFDFVRDVDYCSASSLLVRRTAWREVGGMDEEYFPAYYEDVDLCFRLRRGGYRVLFEPRSWLVHVEGSSTGGDYRLFLTQRNRARFAAAWQQTLRSHEPSPPEDGDIASAIDRAVARARGVRRTVLIIDDRLPDASLGSGFGRMRTAIEHLAPLFHVSFHATTDGGGNRDFLRDEGVRVIEADLESHLRKPSTLYDAVIVSRPHNAERLMPLLRRTQPMAQLIYDTEALWHRRLEREASLLDTMTAAAATTPPAVRVRVEALLRRRLRAEIRPLQLASEIAALARDTRTSELRNAAGADHIVCISADEAAIVGEAANVPRISVVSPLDAPVTPTVARFESRRDMAFVAGWLGGPSTPNVDGIVWFIDAVLPLVVQEIPWVRLCVTGGAPPDAVAARRGPNVQLLGHVENLRSVYESVRLVVVPLRFGSGVKIKTAESLLHRVPVVATHVGAEGIELHDTQALNPSDDTAELAAQTVALLRDPAVWRQRVEQIDALLARHRRTTGPRWNQLVHAVVDARQPTTRVTIGRG